MRDMEDPEFSDLITVRPEHLGERPGHCREDYLAGGHDREDYLEDQTNILLGVPRHGFDMHGLGEILCAGVKSEFEE